MSDDDADTSLGTLLGVQGSGRVTGITRRTISKAEANLLQSNALTVDDDPFKDWYLGDDKEGVKLVRPTYDPILLWQIANANNAMLQCVSAMEVNIDGTGYEIDRRDGETPAEEDPKIKAIEGFFDEPYPDVSFLTQRRALRRDMEVTGNGYIEVLRNKKGQITLINPIDAKLTRLVVLDEPTVVTRTVSRFGTDQTIQVEVRERRFAQVYGKKLVFFKEFGSVRKLNKKTGLWDDNTPPELEATEVIHLTVGKDILTAYGVPRWINQMPSVLGSRKAEEFNLEFFDHGGLPPALIMVQGGQLTPEARKALTDYLSGKAKFKQRGVLVEAFGLGGDLNSAGSMKISVERFGAERQGDSMFEKYDLRCFDRVRSAFRLPPMFLGYSQDYNFATAYTAYMVAEAQVFAPEREEFDEIINVRIMNEIAPDYWFRSLPLSVKDIETQLKALALVAGSVENESLIDAVNEMATLTLVAKEPAALPNDPTSEKYMAAMSAMAPANDPKKEQKVAGEIVKIDDTILQELADDWSKFWAGDISFEDHSVRVMKDLIDTLSPPVRKLFNGYVAMRMLPEHRYDFEGSSTLLAHAGACLSEH